MLLLHETRCGLDEVRHYGAVAIATSSGVHLFGEDPPSSIPLRSTGKPFFLGALLETIFRGETFSSEELALMSASHNGEPQHVSLLTSLLARYELSPELLKCGVHSKWREWSIPASSGNNCSGKHAAFLIAHAIGGYDVKGYLDPASAVNRLVLEKITKVYGMPPTTIGVDGCSLPTYSYPLGAIASAFRDYSMDHLGPGYAMVRQATIRAPFYVAGTDRLESYLIGRYRFAAKSGSEGLWALGVPMGSLGIAVKNWGGVEAATQAVLLDILHNRKLIDVHADEYLSTYHNRTIYSLAGRISGEIKVCFRELLEG